MSPRHSNVCSFPFWLCCSKGISQSALPYRRSVPSWLKLNAEDVKEQIKKLGKKGMTPSQIGEYATHTIPLRLCSTVLFQWAQTACWPFPSIRDERVSSAKRSKFIFARFFVRLATRPTRRAESAHTYTNAFHFSCSVPPQNRYHPS